MSPPKELSNPSRRGGAVEPIEIRILRQRISNEELRAFLHRPFAEMIKFVVDVDQQVIALGGELHADAEELLLEAGSFQENLWGGNLYPDGKSLDEQIEYSALINIRPSQENRSMLVQSAVIRTQMQQVVQMLIEL